MENDHASPSNLLMKGLEWVVTLAYLNLLWLMFSLAGLIVAGMGPSTLAVFSLIRKKLIQGDLSHIFSQFKQEFKTYFKTGNSYFVIVFGVGLFLFTDMQIIQALPVSSVIQNIVIPALLILTALVIVVSTFTIGIMLEFESNLFKSIKKAFWIMLISPVASLVIIHAFLIQFLIISYVPAFFPFFSVTVYALLSQWMMNKAFRRMKVKKKSI